MQNEPQFFIISPDFWQTLYGVLRIIFIVLDVALVIGFLVALVGGLHFRQGWRPGKRSRAAVLALRSAVFRERWELVTKRFVPNSGDAMRLAIIEADALIDSILKEFGFEGEHMADRLSKVGPDSLRCLDRLWRAHRLRNELVHTPGFTLLSVDAERAMRDYEAFLKEVKILNV
jgi:hypothetical protein